MSSTLIIMLVVLAIILVYTLFPLSPLLLGVLGFETPSEVDSGWGALPWLAMFTLPTGGIALVIWAGIGLYLWLYNR